jgi:hypothetical protein
MVGRTRLSTPDEERAALERRARSANRAEADRAGATLWSSEGRTGAVAAPRTRPKPGKAPWKSQAALAVIEELLAAPLAERPRWTLPRLQRAVRERAGISSSPSRLSVVPREKGIFAGAGHATPSRAGRTPRPWTGPGGG